VGYTVSNVAAAANESSISFQITKLHSGSKLYVVWVIERDLDIKTESDGPDGHKRHTY
jgi:hypothetical protein